MVAAVICQTHLHTTILGQQSNGLMVMFLLLWVGAGQAMAQPHTALSHAHTHLHPAV